MAQSWHTGVHFAYFGTRFGTMIDVKFSNSRKKSGHSPWLVEINFGKRQRKYFPTREKAYDHARELKRSIGGGYSEDSPTETIRLSVLFKKHILKLQSRGARQETITSRKLKCNTFIKRLDDPCISKVTRQDFKDYILQFGSTETTRRSIRSEVGAFLNWAFENDHTSTNYYKVTWEVNLEDEKLVGILTPEETKELMDSMPDGYKVAMALCLFAGIRPYEVPRIKWENIYREKKLIIIEGKQSKTRRNRKLTDLPDNLFRWIDRYQTLSMGKDGPINRYRMLAKHRKNACKKVGILYPHDGARHSFGTYGYFMEGGKSWAMRCMGHNDQSTYDRFYLNSGVGPKEANDYFNV